jgi:hypothetical protein
VLNVVQRSFAYSYCYMLFINRLGILDNLQQGEYIISIDRKLIFDINDLQTPLYKFSLDATDAVDYEFDEL